MVGKKEEFWRNKQNGDFPGKMFLKGTSYLFQQTSTFRKNVLKIGSYKKMIYGKKIEKPSFLLTKAIDVLKNIQGL